MLHVFQRVESIHKMQEGLSFEYQNRHTRCMFNINIIFFLHKIFEKRVLSTHTCLAICFRTVKDTTCKIKIDELLN